MCAVRLSGGVRRRLGAARGHVESSTTAIKQYRKDSFDFFEGASQSFLVGCILRQLVTVV